MLAYYLNTSVSNYNSIYFVLSYAIFFSILDKVQAKERHGKGKSDGVRDEKEENYNTDTDNIPAAGVSDSTVDDEGAQQKVQMHSLRSVKIHQIMTQEQEKKNHKGKQSLR